MVVIVPFEKENLNHYAEGVTIPICDSQSIKAYRASVAHHSTNIVMHGVACDCKADKGILQAVVKEQPTTEKVVVVLEIEDQDSFVKYEDFNEKGLAIPSTFMIHDIKENGLARVTSHKWCHLLFDHFNSDNVIGYIPIDCCYFEPNYDEVMAELKECKEKCEISETAESLIISALKFKQQKEKDYWREIILENILKNANRENREVKKI